jgi:hypothetical protein
MEGICCDRNQFLPSRVDTACPNATPEDRVEGFGAGAWPSQAPADNDLDSLGRCDPARLPGGWRRALEALLTGRSSPGEFKGGRGRVKVYGCSPGCIAVSIGLSLFLTLAVNACIRLMG